MEEYKIYQIRALSISGNFEKGYQIKANDILKMGKTILEIKEINLMGIPDVNKFDTIVTNQINYQIINTSAVK